MHETVTAPKGGPKARGCTERGARRKLRQDADEQGGETVAERQNGHPHGLRTIIVEHVEAAAEHAKTDRGSDQADGSCRTWTEIRDRRERTTGEIRGRPGPNPPAVPRDEAARRGPSEERTIDHGTTPSRRRRHGRARKYSINSAPNSRWKFQGAASTRVPTDDPRRTADRSARKPHGHDRSAYPAAKERAEEPSAGRDRRVGRTYRRKPLPEPLQRSEHRPQHPRTSPSDNPDRRARARSPRSNRYPEGRSKRGRMSPKRSENPEPPEAESDRRATTPRHKEQSRGFSDATQSKLKTVTRTDAANAKPTPGVATTCAFKRATRGGESPAVQPD